MLTVGLCANSWCLHEACIIVANMSKLAYTLVNSDQDLDSRGMEPKKEYWSQMRPKQELIGAGKNNGNRGK